MYELKITGFKSEQDVKEFAQCIIDMESDPRVDVADWFAVNDYDEFPFIGESKPQFFRGKGAKIAVKYEKFDEND